MQISKPADAMANAVNLLSGICGEVQDFLLGGDIVETSALNVATHCTALEELVQQRAVLLKKKLAKCRQIVPG